MKYKININKFSKIISLIFFCGIIGIIITLNSIDKLAVKNTTEFNAIVKKIEITEAGENLYINIYTKEPEKTLNISTSVSRKISRSDIESLQEGEVIVFRIENNMIKRFENNGFGSVVSIKTDEKEILSLDDYNVFIHDSVSIARKVAMFFSLVFLLIFIIPRKRTNQVRIN